MRKFLIVGMGDFGVRLARYLQDLHNEVCIIDKDMEAVEKYKDEFYNISKCDGMQKNALEELAPEDYDACIVTVGDDFQSSLQITSNLKELDAKRIVTKCYSDVQDKFLKMAGADVIIYPEKESAEKLAATLTKTNLLDFMKIGDNFGIFETIVPKRWNGKKLRDLEIRKKYNINVIAIKKNNEVSIPTPDYVFEGCEAVFVFGDLKVVRDLFKL